MIIIINKIKKFLLNKSNSYNYYKNQNELLKKELNITKKSSKMLEKLYSQYIELSNSQMKFNDIYLSDKEKLYARIDDSEKKFNDIYLSDKEKLYARIDDSEKKFNTNYLNLKKNMNTVESHYELFNLIFLEYELQPKGLLNKIRLLAVEMMLLIEKVCKKYNLSFWLDYGTLLGAVRHEGNIPWDDDIDFGMMRKDFDIFIKVFKDEIDRMNLSHVISISIDQMPRKNLIMSFIKIYYGYIKLVDIFPYDFRDSSEGLDLKRYTNERNNFFLRLNKGESKDKLLDEVFNNLNLEYDDGKYVIPGVEGVIGSSYNYPLNIYEKSIIFPYKKLNFEGYEFNCPNDYDTYLKGIYGNYMSIPKVIYSHQLLKTLRKKDNNIEYYVDQAIIMMKRVNENFQDND